ncbi:hypothetical protein BDF20DRAFT_973868 [Mycotypha africana]|uniref:uncharacterized protein n=1 Tax=Mycotypha africana TaxID=64632 RepID=UPI0023001AED|nr:uncharacterized protein BDF20DRAFT_973868 [Mycotypha africana]KAI8979085.1 hypothetical protein BDF20DRAFT_973868 [Mycotypha africana]
MNSAPIRKFRIKSPCSTANIGPGFDVLGISLSLYLTIDVTIYDKSSQLPAFKMTYSGEGATDVPLTPEDNLITKTALYVLAANGIFELSANPLHLHVDNPIPLGRGLGSSGAAVVGGVLLGNALGNLKLSHDRLLDYCLMIERHPDNVAAALMGGFVASYLRELEPGVMEHVPSSETLLSHAVEKKEKQEAMPQPPLGIGHYVRLGWSKDIKCIAIIPQFQVATAKARAVLPNQYERKDIVFNFQRLAVLTTALSQTPPDPELIYNAMQDKIHQPYRSTLIPGLPQVLSQVTYKKHDGLLGICLSGAGPTILALATKNFDDIAKAAIDIFKQHGQQCDPKPKYKKSWQYEDACDNVYLYCDPSTSTCQYKGCAHTDYLRGWNISFRAFPERCNGTTFCPDNQSRCTEKVPIGSHCEIQRDDECDTIHSICLNSTCFVKAAPLGGNCGIDITTYITNDATGVEMEQTIIRDNCTDGHYCDNHDSFTCIWSKQNGLPCHQDRECLSGTCSNEGVCVDGPDIFHPIPAWSWGVFALAIVLFILIVLSGLWVLHRYQSKLVHQKRIKFFDDNEAFGKYASLASTNQLSMQQPQGFIYLTTPDYYTSQALSRKKGGAPPPSFASTSSFNNPFAASSVSLSSSSHNNHPS